MKSISLDITKAAQFLSEGAVKAYEPKVRAAQEALENGTCPGNDFLGWLHLPSSITPEFLDEVQAVAETMREKCEAIWSSMSNYYDPDDICQAALLMVSVADKYKGNNNFEYDLVDIVRQAMADQGRVQYLEAMADYKAFRRKAFMISSQRFLDMLLAQDKLLGTRNEFRLGRWIEMARNLGNTPEEKDLYEWNARVQITTWGNRVCADQGGLRDYAHKEWQGLLKDFYYMRWSAYFKAINDEMDIKSKPDIEKLGDGKYKGLSQSELLRLALEKEVKLDFYAMEEPWTLQHNPYSPLAPSTTSN